MSASYLAFRARMLSINPLTDLVDLISALHLDLHAKRNAHRREHYQAMEQESREMTWKRSVAGAFGGGSTAGDVARLSST